jgi:hypothetical protein
MTLGVLIYSFDTPGIAYSKLTERCISHVNEHLRVPITVVSDNKSFVGVNNIHIDPKVSNRRRYNNEIVPWYNLERTQAYVHSPYETTILIDCDYFVMSDYLLQLSEAADDILLHTKLHDVTGRNNIFHTRESLLPLVWATVVVFKKNSFVEGVFDMIQHVQNYYQYYKNLYRIAHLPYRNDYAFAIALHQMYGQNNKDYSIPTPMNMIGKHGKIIEMTNNSMTFSWGERWSKIHNQDIHVFDKEFFNV